MNDDQLKQLLAKMLPDLYSWNGFELVEFPDQYERCRVYGTIKVKDTELLHLCSLVEAGLDRDQRQFYAYLLRPQGYSVQDAISATWQQRTEALASVKGVTL